MHVYMFSVPEIACKSFRENIVKLTLDTVHRGFLGSSLRCILDTLNSVQLISMVDFGNGVVVSTVLEQLLKTETNFETGNDEGRMDGVRSLRCGCSCDCGY